FQRHPAPALEPMPASVPGRPAVNARSVARALAPELVPFVSERDRIAIRDIYVPAQPYKALAVGLEYMGFVRGQPSQEIADARALDACTMRPTPRRAASGLPPVRVCEVYASGDVVVTKRGQPPMPPGPWLIRDPSVERPFVAADLPLVSAAA